MVELQIVILAVAGSSPVGHPGFRKCGFRNSECGTKPGAPPAPQSLARLLLDSSSVINPTLLSNSTEASGIAFWQRILNDGALENSADLEKILAGCEFIAALDDVELLAA